MQKCALLSSPNFLPDKKYMIIQDVVSKFGSSATHGLTASVIPSLRDDFGYNEFSVTAPEPLLLKFAKSFYESPLILLLCGSALVSAIMGNVDDAISITIAVVIVLTGAWSVLHTRLFELELFLQLASYRNDAQNNRSSRSTSSFLITVTSSVTESSYIFSQMRLSRVILSPSSRVTAFPPISAFSPPLISRSTRAV